jgi:hypothetical protein
VTRTDAGLAMGRRAMGPQLIRNFWEDAAPQRVVFAPVQMAVIINQSPTQADPSTNTTLSSCSSRRRPSRRLRHRLSAAISLAVRLSVARCTRWPCRCRQRCVPHRRGMTGTGKVVVPTGGPALEHGVGELRQRDHVWTLTRAPVVHRL